MSAQKGYSSQEKDERLSAQFQTIEPVRELQFGSSVVAHQFVFEVGNDAAEAGSTEAVIVATGHAALKGDVIRLTSGALSGREVKVWEVATNSITLAETLPSAVAAAVTFQILRHKYPTVDSSGVLNVNSVEVATAADGGALPALTKVVAGYDGTNVQVLRTDVNGELQVDVLSSALPSGAATEATLSTLATEATVSTLASEATLSTLATESTLSTVAGDVSSMLASVILIEAGTPDSLGQATMANSMPVVLASNQTAIPVTDNGSSLTVDGTVAATQSGTWNINNVLGTVSLPTGAATETTLNAVKTSVEIIDNAISGNEMQVDVVTSALPTGAATSANQTNGSQKSQIVDGAGDVVDVVALNVAIQGTDKGLVTNTIIHGETTGGGGGYVDVKVTPSGALVADVTGSVTVSGTVAATQSGTWNINNISGTVSLPTGAATESTLSTLNTKVPSQGQAAMAASLPVVIASNQTAIPASQSGTWNINNISGTVSLPTGAATESTLSSINTKTPSLGQANMAGSQPVVIASNQSNVPVSQAGRSIVTRARNVYSSTNVTTAAYVQLVASLGSAVNEVEIFDSSGETLVLATGGAGSEVDQAFVFPGGNGRIPLAIAASTRVSIKAVSATANAGEIAINFYS